MFCNHSSLRASFPSHRALLLWCLEGENDPPTESSWGEGRLRAELPCCLVAPPTAVVCPQPRRAGADQRIADAAAPTSMWRMARALLAYVWPCASSAGQPVSIDACICFTCCPRLLVRIALIV